MQHNHPAKYWHQLEDGKIQCDVCPNACKLNVDQQGRCFVRMREQDQMVLTTYGLASSIAIDPVEKKPLYQFLPGSKVYSFGTVGCNLSCKFCQNWQISKAKEMRQLATKAMPKDIAKSAKESGCESVAFTYNEPSIFLEYAIDTAKECHKLGLKTIAVTNGYICGDARAEFYQHMDAANIDLKGFTEKFYQKLTGTHLEPVLDTLKYVANHTDTWLEITTLLIPGHNDSDKEIDQETKWIAENLGLDVPVHFTAFHPAYQLLDVASTPLETVRRAREIALKNGLKYVYTGNVIDTDGNSTYCANCGKLLIERGGFSVRSNKLINDGHCPFCDTLCAGIFQDQEKIA